MPKVKQVDFDLNAINNELTGESSDLHREIMNNLIEANPYVFKITKQPKGWTIHKGETKILRTEAVGIKLKYQWQFSDDNINFSNVATNIGRSKKLVLPYNLVTRNLYERCKITDKYGNILYTDSVQIIKG